MEKETRTFPLTDVELRAATEGDGTTMVGYAAVFDSWSEDLGGFKETIRKGAFTRAIKEDDVKALWNHDSNIVLGSTASGTLRMKEDTKGLAIEVDLDPTNQMHQDLVAKPMKRGDVDKMSFGFTVSKDGDKWAESDKGEVTRELLDVGLFDVSPVTYPAYAQTEVAVRSYDKFVEERSKLDEESEEVTETPAWLDHMKRRLQLDEAISNVTTTPERSGTVE